MSFLLDPPLLAASGAVAEALANGNARRLAAVRAGVLTGFVGISLALYANVSPVVRIWPTLGARTGREFMLTSGLARVEERRMTKAQHLAALSLFALYPVWFELGRRLAPRDQRLGREAVRPASH